MGLDDLLNKLEQLKPVLKKDYCVKDIGVFGSYARNEATDKSDIDILIEFTSDMDLFKMVDLSNYLETNLGKKVDISNAKKLKKQLRQSILSEVKYI